MTPREQLQQDLAQHIQLREQAIANANAISGVIQYLERKLAENDDSRIVVPSSTDLAVLKKGK